MRTTSLNRTLIIVGIILMVLTSIIFGLYVKVDEWYIKAFLYILIPIVFVIWWICIQITDDIILGIRRLKGLKDKENSENEDYEFHLSKADTNLEYISRHSITKYSLLQDKKTVNIKELDSFINQTQTSIENLSKQLNELNEIRKSYEDTEISK